MAINMSYCMFENTYLALKECSEALGESIDPIGELSESEQRYSQRLFKLCRMLADDFEDM